MDSIELVAESSWVWGWLLVGLASLLLVWLILSAFRKALVAYRQVHTYKLEHQTLLLNLEKQKAEWAAVSARELAIVGKSTGSVGCSTASASIAELLLPLVLTELRTRMLVLDDALQASGLAEIPDPAPVFEILQSVERLIQVPESGVSSTEAIARLQAFARCFGYPAPTVLLGLSENHSEHLSPSEWKDLVLDWCQTHLRTISVSSSL